MWKQKVLACYSRAVCRFSNGMFRIYSDNRELGIGISEEGAWADAYLIWCTE